MLEAILAILALTGAAVSGVAGADRQPNVLVVGSIHGDEREGHEVIRRLRQQESRLDVGIHALRTVNPDGVAAASRGNRGGVDLNRNFPFDWRPGPPSEDGYYPGARPASEPETRATMRLIRDLRPAVTIWYHQPWGQVLLPCQGRARAEKLYARVAGMDTRRCRGQRLPGTATSWQEHRVGGTAFVVELPAGELDEADAQRHVSAARRVASRFG